MTSGDPGAGAGAARAGDRRRPRTGGQRRTRGERRRPSATSVVAPLALIAVSLGATACAGGRQAAPQTTAAASSAPSPVDDTPPPDPVPARPADACPYLQTAWIETANGEHIAAVRLSADEPDPACFFYRRDGGLDVTVQVYRGTARSANALLDRVAPVATSDKATEPAGWTGGLESFGPDKGAVYAVRKEGTGLAVVVHTDQAQTLKAKRIAEQTIQDLNL